MAEKEVKQSAEKEATPQGPRIPRREVWVDLPAEYAGFKVKLWSNYPQRVHDQIYDKDLDEDGRERALRQIVLEHNGWCDEEGKPLPPAQDEAFWDALPPELIGVVLVVIQDAVSILPNLLRGRRRS